MPPRTGILAPSILLGDFNAYAKEDPILYLTNSAGYTSAENISTTSPPVYSYVFDGQWGTLDYIFLDDSFTAAQLKGVSVWHVNSDEPSLFDYNDYENSQFDGTTPWRYSDHDPIVLTVDIP